MCSRLKFIIIMAVRIVSINVRGIKDEQKRRSIFNYYRKRSDIICLQETHSEKQLERIWETEWGGKAIFSHGNSDSRGVCILISKKYCDCITNYWTDEAGRIACCNLKIMEKKVAIINIYAPNEDKPEFYYNIFKKAIETNENNIIIGDFNVVLNNEMDRLNCMENKKKSQTAILDMMEELYYADIWRTMYPENKRYSWFKLKPNKIASRLDYSLISNGLVDNCVDAFYGTGILTDHSAFYLLLELNQNERGRGYWKMNTSHLIKPDFMEMMNSFLDQFLIENENMEIIRKWELLKFDIAVKCKEYAREQASEKNLIISQLSEKIMEYEDKFDKLSENSMKILQDSKSEMQDILNEQIQGIIFRTKCNWMEQGEMNSAFFYNLEKSKYNAKTATAIKVHEKLITDDQEILEAQRLYYADLYKSNTNIDFDLKENYGVSVSQEDYIKQDLPFTYEEISSAVYQLNNNKCPGFDGLPIDLYKVFWKKIGPMVYEVIMQCYDMGRMYKSARMGILNLIPKPNKDPKNLANQRPLTLLNSCYKIIEKAIANRLLPALQKLIHSDQTGFLPQRRIAVNLRKFYDIMWLTERNQEEAIVLSLDFQKCFDMIEFSAIRGAMKLFGFAEYLIKWIEILYTNFEVVVQNSGKFSKKINVERGVHQGGLASALIFLICAETLALMLRENENICGITIGDINKLLNQYADDADIFMIFDQKSLDHAPMTLEEFRKMSGFTISYDKTQILRIGALRNSNAMLYTAKKITWTNGPIKVLGVNVVSNMDSVLDTNYEPTINKITTIFKRWSARNLSLIGKINIVNTLTASLFIYKMMVLPKIPKKYVVKYEI